MFLGNGDGTFSSSPILTTYSNLPLGFIAAGDFNGDGKQDLATFEIKGTDLESYKLCILPSNGDGTFRAPVLSSLTCGYAANIHVADIDHDGISDIVVADSSNQQVDVLFGTGKSRLSAPVTISVPLNYYTTIPLTKFTSLPPGNLAIGDLNHDGQQDIVVAEGASALGSGVGVLLNNGNRTFAPLTTYNVPAAAVLVGNVNKHGYTDVVALSGSSAAVLTGSSSGVLTPPAPNAWYLYGYAAVFAELVDVAGDGNLGIISSGYSNVNSDASQQVISLVRGVGNGQFIAPSQSPPNAIPYGGTISNADFNNDGKRDLVVGSILPGNGTVRVFMGNGDGTFTPGASYNLLESANDTTTAIVKVLTADINNDGTPDLIVVKNVNSTSYGNVDVLLGNGDGTFQAPISEDALYGNTVVSAAVGDFNIDGNVDLAIGTGTATNGYSGTVNVLTGNGTGALTQVSTTTLPAENYSITVADFNGDGDSDIAATGISSYNPNAGNYMSSINVLFGNGSGGMSLNASYTTNNSAISLVSADFNGDKKPDLALSTLDNDRATDIEIYINNGSGGFTLKDTISTDCGALAVGDFDGDGKIDLVTSNDGPTYSTSPEVLGYGGFVSMMLGNGDGTFQAPLQYTSGADSKALTVGHFNGDDKLDIATANFYDGTVTTLLNQPTVAVAAHATMRPITTKTAVLEARGKYIAPGGANVLTYTWSSTGPAPVTFSANATSAAQNTTATFTASGAYIFTCTITDPTGGVVPTTFKANVTLS